MTKRRRKIIGTASVNSDYEFVDSIEAVGDVGIELFGVETTTTNTSYIVANSLNSNDSLCLFNGAKNLYYVGFEAPNNIVNKHSRATVRGTMDTSVVTTIFLYNYGGVRLSVGNNAASNGYRGASGYNYFIQIKNSKLYRLMYCPTTITANKVDVANDLWQTERTMEFLPCIRKSDNVVGLYDIVSNIFYTQTEGDGYLVAGLNV